MNGYDKLFGIGSHTSIQRRASPGVALGAYVRLICWTATARMDAFDLRCYRNSNTVLYVVRSGAANIQTYLFGKTENWMSARFGIVLFPIYYPTFTETESHNSRWLAQLPPVFQPSTIALLPSYAICPILPNII